MRCPPAAVAYSGASSSSMTSSRRSLEKKMPAYVFSGLNRLRERFVPTCVWIDVRQVHCSELGIRVVVDVLVL
jgi:hypothetical protein